MGALLEAYQYVENHETPEPLYQPLQVILSHNQGIKQCCLMTNIIRHPEEGTFKTSRVRSGTGEVAGVKDAQRVWLLLSRSHAQECMHRMKKRGNV
eukprot:scaffold3704_cov41-Attheya_sp.AAC.1